MYDPLLDQWERTLAMDESLAGSVGFSIDGKGYVVGGITSGNPNCLYNVWMYDPAINTWSEKASLPIGQCAGTGTVINGKAYVGLGYGKDSFFEYDPSLDSWKQLADYPGIDAGDLVNFKSNEEIYIGFGLTRDEDAVDSTIFPTTDVWKYDLTKDNWFKILKILDEDIPHFSEAVTFQIEDRLFIGSGTVLGANNTLIPTNAFYEIIIE